jgi:ubiquinone/menaquinone biosynthesis C-methylase UbiE
VDGIERALEGHEGGAVLDVATQSGGFVKLLMEHLTGFDRIVGIDISDAAIEAARKAIDDDRVSFEAMDAASMAFADGSFDTASIAVSLHHLSDVGAVLDEMKRVLKPGGRFIAVEMHRDAETEPERNSANLHQWAAEIDTALGRLHNGIFARDEILDQVSRLGLADVESYDWVDRESDPLDSAKLEHIEMTVARMSERAAEADGADEFRRRGERILSRIREVGARMEPMLVITGRKPQA